MPNIRIERVPIPNAFFGIPLGWLRADHLQLVYQQDTLDYGYYQDRWLVLEGLREDGPQGPTIGVVGADGFTTLSEANKGKTGAELLDAIHYPWWRGSRIVPSLDPFNDWGVMTAIGNNIEGQAYPYHAFAFDTINIPGSTLPASNSSSVIASLLFYIGIDIAQNLPYTFLRFTTGTNTILGTTEDDEIDLMWSFDTVLGGAGNDKFKGTDDGTRFEKFYGGLGDDEFEWSAGQQIYHGGQPRLSYDADGTDLVDYANAGVVTIELIQRAVPHLVPNMTANHGLGFDYLMSIERLRWNPDSDEIELGEGLNLTVDKHFLLGFDEDDDDEGDTLDGSGQQSSILLRPSDVSGIALASSLEGSATVRENGGLWLESFEWLIGSAGDDRLYAPEHFRGLDGAEGNDLVDGRLATPFVGGSPDGYDIELSGGGGDDTIISGSGRSIAYGGAGADMFVLSAMSEDSATAVVEFVIADADAADRLLVPYNFIAPQIGEFEGSPLFPILGGVGHNVGTFRFADLPQNPAPGPHGVLDSIGNPPNEFIWQYQNDRVYGNDPSAGVIDFAGRILFNRDGADLLIHIFSGFEFEDTYIGRDELEHTGLFLGLYPNTETVVRVKDFTEGMLGIRFYDLGEVGSIDFVDEEGEGSATVFSGWDSAVSALTNGGSFFAPIEARPDDAIYDAPDETPERSRIEIIGTAANDVIVAQPGPAAEEPPPPLPDRGAEIDGGQGDDDISGTFRSDRIDGGEGADVMRGGGGADFYFVDSAGDTVTERPGEGLDEVFSSVDFILTDHVERLTLIGTAVAGTGNGLDNRILGNDAGNILSGGDGDDTLAGYAGDDVLDGGEGNDGFVIGAGDGYDRIRDTGSAADTDVLILANAAPIDVSVTRLASAPDDVVLRIADGGRAVLEDFLAGHSADTVEFQDGTVWTRAELTALALAAAPSANESPIALPDGDFIAYQSVITLPAAVLLENDVDPEGQPLSIISASSTTPGFTAAVLPDGAVQVTAPVGFTGLADLSYTISDGAGGTATATVSLGYIENAAPVFNSAPLPAIETSQASPFTLTLPIDLYVDPDGHSLVYTARLQGGGTLPAWLAYDADTRTFSGTPPVNFQGTLTIEIIASDSETIGATTFDLIVTSLGDPPVAVPDRGFETVIDTPLTIAPAALLANDSDPDQTALAIASVSAAEGGTVALSLAGDVLFTPAAGYVGPASFTYEIVDGNGDTATAAVALDVIWGPAGGAPHEFGPVDNDFVGTVDPEVISGGGGNDVLNAGGGDDIFLTSSRPGFTRYIGGAGFDRVQGSDGDDIIGITGARQALVGIEALDGGRGYDILLLADTSVYVDLSVINFTRVEMIQGGAGLDTIVSSVWDDVIGGGASRDRFRFTGSFGNDTITDFVPDTTVAGRGDSLELVGQGFTSFAEVMAQTFQDGADTVITVGSNSIRLVGVTSTSLIAADFVL